MQHKYEYSDRVFNHFPFPSATRHIGYQLIEPGSVFVFVVYLNFLWICIIYVLCLQTDTMVTLMICSSHQLSPDKDFWCATKADYKKWQLISEKFQTKPRSLKKWQKDICLKGTLAIFWSNLKSFVHRNWSKFLLPEVFVLIVRDGWLWFQVVRPGSFRLCLELHTSLTFHVCQFHIFFSFGLCLELHISLAFHLFEFHNVSSSLFGLCPGLYYSLAVCHFNLAFHIFHFNQVCTCTVLQCTYSHFPLSDLYFHFCSNYTSDYAPV